MHAIPRWFDRRFEYSPPLELLPNVLARLRGTPARLQDLLHEAPPHALLAKTPGWSAQEQVGHLLDIEPLWLARVEDYAAGRDALTATDLGNRKTDEANHNARPLEEILAAFRPLREQLLQRVAGLEAQSFTRAIPHPRLKTPMRLMDHLYFVAEHDDHHLATIWELLDPDHSGA